MLGGYCCTVQCPVAMTTATAIAAAYAVQPWRCEGCRMCRAVAILVGLLRQCNTAVRLATCNRFPTTWSPCNNTTVLYCTVLFCILYPQVPNKVAYSAHENGPTCTGTPSSTPPRSPTTWFLSTAPTGATSRRRALPLCGLGTWGAPTASPRAERTGSRGPTSACLSLTCAWYVHTNTVHYIQYTSQSLRNPTILHCTVVYRA